MKKTFPVILTILTMAFLGSCSGWVLERDPFGGPTPFLPPTNTPFIVTPTPVVIGASPTPPPQVPTSTPILFITPTSAPTIIPSETAITVPTDTSPPGGPSVSVEVLGCNTSIDVTHGMGEVTNAFVVLRNTGIVELTNLSVTLNALDEGREHPDKTLEVSSLPAGYRVMLKMTVDSTYREETPIQVEIRGDAGLFHRVGAAACRDIGLFAPNPGDLNTPVPVNP
ncbi:MAG TPA: hypothetical protein VK900_01150 [Anaerolineales bacterium]|nr:hypothetical protein [Anaerolineales bacterium]